MDYYLNELNQVNRLVKEWEKYGKIIIAYDFDDTVYDFHKQGRKYEDIIALLKRCDNIGAHFIVFTCCGEDEYMKIKDYLYDNKIPFDRINENMDFVKFTGKKVYYNILLDDRAGLKSAYSVLLDAVKIMEDKL
jgi:hypothetical protein